MRDKRERGEIKMTPLTAFFIGLIFTWLGILYAELLGWFAMFVFGLEIIFLNFLDGS